MIHGTAIRWMDGHPHLRIRDGEPISLMGPLRIAVGQRRCIGHRLGDRSVPCPDDARPSGRQCARCAALDTFAPCMRCDGSRCPALHPDAARHCQDTHHLYLAHFGGGPIKVGTAIHGRQDARPAEQGPLAAIRVARGPGPSIKRLERAISRATSMVEAYRRATKLRWLRARTTEEDAFDALLTASSSLRTRAIGPDALWHPPQRVSLPALARRTRQSIDTEAELPVEEGRTLEGTVVGAVGSVLVLEEPAGRMLVDAGALVGRLLDLDPRGSPRRPVVQLGLF